MSEPIIDRSGGMKCERCGKPTGNNNQGHYWALCKKKTLPAGAFHFCCPDLPCEHPMPERATGQQMCEAIARWRKAEYGEDLDPEAFWNASPRGELLHVFEFYELAKAAGYPAERSEDR